MTSVKSQESEQQFYSLMQRKEKILAILGEDERRPLTRSERSRKRGAMTDALVTTTDPTVVSRRRIRSRDSSAASVMLDVLTIRWTNRADVDTERVHPLLFLC